jgi:hypothetical protein
LRNYLFFPRHRHDGVMDLSDHFWSQLAGQPAHGRVIRRLAAAHARELAIDQVGAYLAAQCFEAVIAHVL